MPLPLPQAFEAWRDDVTQTGTRRAELCAKFLGRYLNARLAKCYLAWVAFVQSMGDGREAAVRAALNRMRHGVLHLVFVYSS